MISSMSGREVGHQDHGQQEDEADPNQGLRLGEVDHRSGAVEAFEVLFRLNGLGRVGHGRAGDALHDNLQLLQSSAPNIRCTILQGAEAPWLLLHPGICNTLFLHFLVDGLEGEAQAAGVDLAVGQAELLPCILVLGILEVSEHDAPSIIIGHLPLGLIGFLRGFQLHNPFLQLKDQCGEFRDGHLDGRIIHVTISRLVHTEIDMYKLIIIHITNLYIHFTFITFFKFPFLFVCMILLYYTFFICTLFICNKV